MCSWCVESAPAAVSAIVSDFNLVERMAVVDMRLIGSDEPPVPIVLNFHDEMPVRHYGAHSGLGNTYLLGFSLTAQPSLL